MAALDRKSIPTDGSNAKVQLTPASIALAQTYDTTISASTEITLNAATTIIRVYAKAQTIFMKWGTADVTSSNFDEIIPAGQICDFYVPVASTNATTGAPVLQTAVNFLEETAGATLVVIEK